MIGPGAGWGYVSASTPAKLASNPTKDAKEDTSLSVMPMYVAAVLRADELMRRTGFPVVPYAKFGLGIAPWKVSGGAGTVQYVDPASSKIVNAADTTFGLHLALGGMLALNFLERRSAARLDETTGVNHIYLYAEWMNAMLNGLGPRPALHVGTSTVIGGIAFDM